MSDPVTEDELVRARIDPAFRQQFLAQNLDRLLEALNKMRRAISQNDDTARQIREGAELSPTGSKGIIAGRALPRRPESANWHAGTLQRCFTLPFRENRL